LRRECVHDVPRLPERRRHALLGSAIARPRSPSALALRAATRARRPRRRVPGTCSRIFCNAALRFFGLRSAPRCTTQIRERRILASCSAANRPFSSSPQKISPSNPACRHVSLGGIVHPLVRAVDPAECSGSANHSGAWRSRGCRLSVFADRARR
jgi:hypothetical protein